MSTKYHLDKYAEQTDKALAHEETKLLLKKRFIWQYLTQKKIKNAIKSKLRINEKDS